MSFTSVPGSVDRSFELVRQSLLQSDGLPFADALTTEQIQEAFEAEGVSFGDYEDDASHIDAIVYTMGVTLWAMLSQALFTDVQRPCRSAVPRVAVYYALLGREVSSTNAGAYCRARAKVPEGAVRHLAVGVAKRCEEEVPDGWLWNERRVLKMNGTTLSMPDTDENQEEYPQANTQAEGVAFPIMRSVAITSLATGMVVYLATGRYAGKETGETALLRMLFHVFKHGDVALFDRYYTGWFMLSLLQEMGVDFATPRSWVSQWIVSRLHRALASGWKA